VPGPLWPGRKDLLHPLNKRLGGPQTSAGRSEEEKNLLPVHGFEPGTVNPFRLPQ
jgi:hypothetical protein